MPSKEYKLRFLPLFEEDLNEIIDYIAIDLNNPIAAQNMVEAVQSAIMERLPFAESFEPFRSSHSRKYPYYRITVKNYTVFYVVIGDIMEVRRILYSRRDWRNLI